jgi:hypothetical protein
MVATLEWLSNSIYILRLHDAPAAKLGDPYVWWTVIVSHEGMAEIKGADRPLPKGGAEAICRALRLHGFAGRIHKRISKGVVREVVKPLWPKS